MKNERYIIYFILSFILLSCSQNNIKQEYCLSDNSHSCNYVDNAERILIYGDTALYDSIFDRFSDDLAMDMMLPFSIIMANKFDYNKAFFDVYYVLMNLNLNFSIYDVEIDSITQLLATEYYLKAIEKGYNIENE